MPDISNVRKVGNLMVVRLSDGSQQTVYPTGSKLWTSGTGYVPPPPAPDDPIAGEGPAPTFERLNPPQSPNQVPRSAYGPYGTKPTGITIHHWGETGQQFQAVVDHLSNPASEVSAHAVVEAGRVAFLVPYSQAAWHSGSAEGNGTTIGLELRPEATDGDYETAAQLIRGDTRRIRKHTPLPAQQMVQHHLPWRMGSGAAGQHVPRHRPTSHRHNRRMGSPAPGGSITSGYGMRGGVLHAGLDISDVGGSGMGGPIRATTDMKITIAKENGTGGLPDAGSYVKGHSISGQQYSFSHFHGHPGTIVVSVGQTVAAGTTLMNVGNSGNSFGSHLHYELWPGHMPGDFFYWGHGTPPDPLPILRSKGIQI